MFFVVVLFAFLFSARWGISENHCSQNLIWIRFWQRVTRLCALLTSDLFSNEPYNLCLLFFGHREGETEKSTSRVYDP